MKNVLYAATRNLYQDVVVSIKSLLHHTKVDNVFLMIEDNQFMYDLPDFVKTINVSHQKYFPDKCPNLGNRCTYMVLLRAVLSDYIDVDTLLSIDYDTIVYQDISPLFDTDISDYYFAAVRETEKDWWAVPEYYNFGVAYMNLRKMDEIKNPAVSLLNSCYFQCAEQDAMNILCRGHILEIPSKYNSNRYTAKCRPEDIAIIHYPGPDKRGFHNSQIYADYLRMPWSEVLNHA